MELWKDGKFESGGRLGWVGGQREEPLAWTMGGRLSGGGYDTI